MNRAWSRGFSTLIFCIVAMVMAGGFIVTLSGSQTMDLNLQVRAENKRVAEGTARNALQIAYAKLSEDRNWGKDGEYVYWESTSSPGATAKVTFRALSDSGHADIPAGQALENPDLFSVNNLGGEDSVLAYNGMVVTPGSVVVVAVGEYRGAREIGYQIFLGSPLPYSLASQGSLKVSGETVVGGLDSIEAVQELSQSELDVDDLSDAGLVSNDEVELSGDIQVVGDVEYLNRISQESSVSVKGEVKQLGSQAELPQIRIEDYDPKGNPTDTSDDLATLVERTEAEVPGALENPLFGFQRFSNDVSFPDGLTLDGSGVFIDGDVVLDGPLVGSGLLVATGSITLRGGADLKADALAAVISGGDLTINGQTQNGQARPSAFQGLMYSQGDLTLSNTRTVGTVVSASDATGAPGSLTIRDSQVISTPDTSSFELVIKNFESGGGGLSTQTQTEKEGEGWEILEPNPADLLRQDENGNPAFIFSDSDLKIRIQQPDGSWRVLDDPSTAEANGLETGEFNSLDRAYKKLTNTWETTRITDLNNKKELVDILEFDINEFLKVSTRLKAKRVFFYEN